MYTTTGSFATANGSKYLQQLCKHFAHKIEVSYEETWGRAVLPFGTAEFTADEAALRVSISTKDPDMIEQARAVIDSHLERFAFREAFTNMDWQETLPAG